MKEARNFKPFAPLEGLNRPWNVDGKIDLAIDMIKAFDTEIPKRAFKIYQGTTQVYPKDRAAKRDNSLKSIT